MKAYMQLAYDSGTRVHFHDVKWEFDLDKKLVGERPEYITKDNWANASKQYGLDFKHISYSITITGYITASSATNNSNVSKGWSVQKVVDLFSQAAEQGGNIGLYFTNNAGTAITGVSAWSYTDIMLMKNKIRPESADEDIPSKWYFTATFRRIDDSV